MKLSELIERLGRSVFEAPFGANEQLIGESPEIAEIRIAVLDEVKKKIQRAGGHVLFPYNVVRILIRAAPNEAAVFEREFFRRFFDEEVRKTLLKEGCRFSDDLRVEIRATEQAEVSDDHWLRVETIAESVTAAPTPSDRRSAKLLVTAGSANRSELPLDKSRINIGRVTDVYKSEGLSRRNDLAFTEDSAINRTVSREHAHILFDKATGEYRLFNDRWYERGNKSQNNCGLWIIRDGMGQEVHRDSRGTRLMAGDEIHFGKAVVIFQLD